MNPAQVDQPGEQEGAQEPESQSLMIPNLHFLKQCTTNNNAYQSIRGGVQKSGAFGWCPPQSGWCPSPVVVKVPLFVMYSITPDMGGAHKLISFAIFYTF